jgi:hypothetical protein
MNYPIVEVINQLIKDCGRNSLMGTASMSMNSDHLNDNGHFIITLKFFKFVTDDDRNKEQREVEIIRTLSFIDIEGFNSNFTQILLNKTPVSLKSDPKNYSLINLKNMIEAVSAIDLEKYSEVNSILVSVISQILKIQNTQLFIFGFIDQNDSSILESTVTLELMNKFKNFNAEYFFDIVQEMNFENSNIDNKYLKEEFHIIEIIVRF